MVVVDAYQSVVDMRGVCSRGLRVFLSLKLKWRLLSTTTKVKWTPMSGGGDRGDDGLGIRKY